MSNSIHGRVKQIIEETNYAFAHCRGSLNVDYAEFATLSLTEFKSALRNPNLTSLELVSLLRMASSQYKVKDPNGCWSTFLASYISQSSNNNIVI